MNAKVTISEQTKAAYLDVLEELVTEELYTAYGVHTVLNQILAKNGSEPIRPQMMYNYLRNGILVKGQKIYGETLRQVSKDEVMEFILRYCVRNQIVIKLGEPESQLELDLEMETTV